MGSSRWLAFTFGTLSEWRRDDATSQLLLPLGGLALAVFTGWALPRRVLAAELDLHGVALAGLHVVLRFVAPALVVAAALASVFG